MAKPCTDECSFDLTGSPLFGPFEESHFNVLFAKMKYYLCRQRQYPCRNIQVAYFTKNSSNTQYTTVLAVNSAMASHAKCVLLNSGFNRDYYCYFYLDLMNSIQPRDDKGIKLGSHITFGPDNKNIGKYSIHNTEYYFDQLEKKVNKKRVVWSEIDPKTSKSYPYSRVSSQYLMKGWEHIVGFFSFFTPVSKGGTQAKITQPGSPGTPGTPGTPATQARPNVRSSSIEAKIISDEQLVDFYMEVINEEDKGHLFKLPTQTQVQGINPFKEFVTRFRNTIPEEKTEWVYMAWYSDTHYIVIGNAISKDEIKFEGQASSSRNPVSRQLFPPKPPSPP